MKESNQLRSVGPIGQEAVHGAVAHLSDKELRSQRYDQVVRHTRDELDRLLIKIRRGEAGYDLIKSFLA
jgi:hypothetical protein